MGRTRQFVTGMIADYVKRSVDEILHWILGRTLRYALSTALFIMAAAFLLLGGAKGLIASGLPPHFAYLAMGAASLLAGFVTLKCCVPAPEGK
jgi:hypothetical protein